MTEGSNESISLNVNRVDGLVSVANGLLGMIPVVGPVVAEVVGAVIPNQRIDRITRFVRILAEKVDDLEKDRVEERLKTPEGVDLLEDSFHQAARALSDERLEYIANVLRSGITEEQARMAEKKRIMWLLGQLDDAEVIMLTWYGQQPYPDEAFATKHSHIVGPRAVHSESTQQEIDDEAMYQARTGHLAVLGLVRPRHKNLRSGQPVTIESIEKLVKPQGYEIASLGRLLLRTITGVQQGDVPSGEQTGSADVEAG